MDKRIIVGVTGASGSIYAERLIEALSSTVGRVYLIVTDKGEQVVRHELTPSSDRFSLVNTIKSPNNEFTPKNLRVFSNDDMFAPIASGSAAATHMVVLPCSMGTLARISAGLSSNLLERSADVMLKQSNQLIISPRETPFNKIHLSNMMSLMDAGAQIAPAMPAFYDKPKTMDDLINFVVGRTLDLLGIETDLFKRWNSRLI